MKELFWGFFHLLFYRLESYEGNRDRDLYLPFFFFIRLDMFNTEGELRATEFTSIVLNSKIGQGEGRTSNLGYMFVPKISFLNSHLANEKERT